MATSIVIPNCLQVRLLWTGASRAFLNVLHAQYTLAGPLNPNVGETLFSAIKAAAATTTWLSHLPTSTLLSGVDVRDLRAPNNPLLPSTSAAVPGSSPSAPIPPQSSMVVTLRTASAGRSFRGRVFLGGLSTSVDDTTGHIVPAGNTDAVAFIVGVQSAMAGQSMTLAIGQKFLPSRPGHGGVTLPQRDANVVPVTAILARDNIFDTQRRRTGAHVGSR